MSSLNKMVAIIKSHDSSVAAIKAISLLEAKGVFAPPRGVVFLKPNIVVPTPFEKNPAEITDPIMVGTLIRYFYEHGARKVLVGEIPAWGASCADAYKASGLYRVVAESGGVLCDLDAEPEVWLPIDGHVYKEMPFPKAIIEADLLVNIPKLKTHFYTDMSIGMKNLFGCFRYKHRKKFHRDADLYHVLTDILKALSPGLTIVDGITAMEGFGPHAGTPVDFGLTIAGTDTLSVDTVVAYLMGLDPKDVGVLQVAQKHGLGSFDINSIEVVGENLEENRKNFLRPVIQFVNKNENVSYYGGGICVGCKSRIASVPQPCDPSKSYAVIVGREPIPMRGDIETDEVWLVGNCGVRAGMAYLLKKAFQGGFKRGVPRIVKIPGCPSLDWFSQKVIFPPLRENGWMK